MQGEQLQLEMGGHIERQCTHPKRPQNSEYFKDKMLLMQAQENGVVLDEEQLLFIASGQTNMFDDDVDTDEAGVFIVILLGFPGPSDGLRLHPIVFFSSGSGLTADSSVLTLTLSFLDFGLDFAQDQVSILAKDKRFGQEMHQSEESKAVYGVTPPRDYSVTYSNKEMSHHTLYGVKCLQDYAATFKITRDDVADSALRCNMGDMVTP
ncbi:hypothetical protein Tco_0646314 [Tanacetum coccineum]